MKRVRLLELGRKPYQEAYEQQRSLMEQLKRDQETGGFLMLVEHPPVFTVGREGGFENLLLSQEEIRARGFELVETDRGGNITYHGPGQLVGYPILNLAHFQKDVRWYVDSVEEVVIKALAKLKLEGKRKEGYRGVWIQDKKICAIGFAVKKWITLHGFAFNINPDLAHFGMINPCGITEYGVTSLQEMKSGIKRDQVRQAILDSFQDVFSCELVSLTEEGVDQDAAS